MLWLNSLKKRFDAKSVGLTLEIYFSIEQDKYRQIQFLSGSGDYHTVYFVRDVFN